MEKKIIAQLIKQPKHSKTMNIYDTVELIPEKSNLNYIAIKNKLEEEIFVPSNYFKVLVMGNDTDGYEFVIDNRDLSENTITKLEDESIEKYFSDLKKKDEQRWINQQEHVKNAVEKLLKEEKENDNMSMDIFEACRYLKDCEEGECLVQKHNDRFTLHYDGKRYFTKFITDNEEIIEKNVELDFATNSSEWIRVAKKYLYRLSGYITIGTSTNLVYSKEMYLSSKEVERYEEALRQKLSVKFRKLCNDYRNIKANAEILYNDNLNVTIQYA